ncbi:MAG TPA: hypothetical protein VGZ90_07670 [Puia sp.]|jgi:hypothetical protein|nr:hypothetical protein [Puia sp.]
MRTVLSSICLFFIWYTASSQSTVEKYCQIEAYHKNGFTSAYTIRLVPGNIDSLFSFKDSDVIDHLKKVNGLTSISDAFNLLADQGWKLIASSTLGNGAIIEFFFKKDFDRRDIN